MHNADPAQKGLSWQAIALVGVLLLVCYAAILIPLVKQWINDEDMGHGFFVPILAGIIAWQRKDRLQERPLIPNWWGLAIIVYAAIQSGLGLIGAELFLARTGFIFSIIGIVLFLGGTYALRVLAFPILLLFFMVPILAIVYSRITLPLQIFASRVAETVLSVLGIPVLREGNVLELANQKLSVVDACSGIRSLLTLSFLSLIYAHFFDSKRWMKAVLFLATIPIAILANASRVTITGILTEYKPDLAQGFFHSAEGWVIFMVALALLILFHQFVNRIYQVKHA